MNQELKDKLYQRAERKAKKWRNTKDNIELWSMFFDDCYARSFPLEDKVFVEITGKGFTLVIWDEIYTTLQEKFRINTVDLLDHYKTHKLQRVPKDERIKLGKIWMAGIIRILEKQEEKISNGESDS